MRPLKRTAKTKKNEIVGVLCFRLKPTKEQEQKLYNQALENRITYHREKGTSIRYTDQQNQLPTRKQEHPESKEVHSLEEFFGIGRDWFGKQSSGELTHQLWENNAGW
ncbi:hypothetical protein SAMN00768000_0237 [Sulfobacillus thermosulfidooxidans DSM 9293]|uniref:Uncharacterized protein n=1 Tax=Sulfobacillus thermosulfidooxidans (strain DSM 9293 / VKM B-1269 / AT-1) TaxID=929705 RepID=A0A1W1W6V8_SULTA|nr:hypothetical protein [Sulfobacillus thermosulfidooxidans]SMC02027.1 hypothetical protein SAMN00768000_0237 [Sulfobacillus thermosulfidooxidans DSM 9293]